MQRRPLYKSDSIISMLIAVTNLEEEEEEEDKWGLNLEKITDLQIKLTAILCHLFCTGTNSHMSCMSQYYMYVNICRANNNNNIIKRKKENDVDYDFWYLILYWIKKTW